MCESRKAMETGIIVSKQLNSSVCVHNASDVLASGNSFPRQLARFRSEASTFCVPDTKANDHGGSGNGTESY